MAAQSTLNPAAAWWRRDVLVASFFINILALALPISILQIYDRIIPNAAYPTFSMLIMLLAVAVLFEAFFKILRSYILSAVGARFEHNALLAAYDRLIQCNHADFEKSSPGSYSDQLQGIHQIRDFYSGQAANLAIDLPFVLIFLGLIYVIAGPLVIIPVTLLTLLVAIVWIINQHLAQAIEQRTETDKRRYNFLIETLQGIHAVKALAFERLMLRRYEKLQARSAKGVVDLSVIQAASMGLASTFSQLSMIAYVAAGSYFVINQSLSLGGLAAGTMLTGRVLQPVIRGLSLWNQYQNVSQSQDKLKDIFSYESETVSGALSLNKIHGDIELRDVSFKYPNAERFVFDSLNLKLNAGSMIGLTGPNGSGLSTVFDLINGTLQPTSGQITVDGFDLQFLDRSAYRRHVGMMNEQGQLFNGTLLENLTMFREGEIRLRAVEVLKLVGLDEFVLRLPKGLETPIGGPAMSNLPLGLLQRIIIARTLIDDPKIILFDNAQSGLDMESDERLRQVFEKIKDGRTILLASYRPSFLKLCDYIYEIRDGVIHQTTYEDFMKSFQSPRSPHNQDSYDHITSTKMIESEA